MPPHSLTDLAGLSVSAEDPLAAVSATAAQLIWVVDPDDVIGFANPAAITALGYESADDLLGRNAHETIHYKHPDGTRYPAAECPMQLPRTTGETVACDSDWFFRRDGYEADDTVTLMASAGNRIPVGIRWPLGGTTLAPIVLKTRRPARVDNYAEVAGQLAEDIREQGIRSSVATPIIVEGRVWGQMVTSSTQEQRQA